MNTAERRPSLWALGGLGPLGLAKRVGKEIGEDEIPLRSTSLAYYFILAVFPAMLFVLSILGFFATAGSHLQQSLFTNLARMMPGSASELIQKTLQEVTNSSGAGKAMRPRRSWSQSAPKALSAVSCSSVRHLTSAKSTLDTTRAC